MVGTAISGASETNANNPASPEHLAHHEAGHAIMAFMFGHRIKSISIVTNPRAGHHGAVKTWGRDDGSQEQDLLIRLAGPVAELLHNDPLKLTFDGFVELQMKAVLEGANNGGSTGLCIEVMAEPDVRTAVNLLASRLMRHKYLCNERVIRKSDQAIWELYSTGDSRVKHAKKSPSRILGQMMRAGNGGSLIDSDTTATAA